MDFHITHLRDTVPLHRASCIEFIDLISFAGGHAGPPEPPTEEISLKNANLASQFWRRADRPHARKTSQFDGKCYF